MNRSLMMKRIERLSDLPTLPTVAMEINRMLQDLDTPIDKLVDFLEQDQALVVKLLKLVNSSFYGFKSRIANLRHAVALMGYNTIQNAIVTVSIIDSVKVKKSINNFDISLFWTHAIGVAVMSRYLATRTKLAASEDAFTAGLVHDIGKIVLLNSFPDVFNSILQIASERQISFYAAEKAANTCPHSLIGGMLASRWLLPDPLVRAIQYHHGTSVQDKANLLAGLVGVADVLVKFIEGAAGNLLDSEMLLPEIRKEVTPVLQDFAQWMPDIKQIITAACEFFYKE
jgi:HD-like signal output (HDOD) protein